MQGLGGLLYTALATPARSENKDVAYGQATIPVGIRSRFVDNVNGLRMHVLEAGYQTSGRPGVLTLAWFPRARL